MKTRITINRAPVLTLWGSVVAERLGFDPKASLTLGKALAGLTAQAKGRNLGIFRAPPARTGSAARKSGLGEEFWISLGGRSLPAKRTEEGIRAVVKDVPVDPDKVEVYLEGAFGEDLEEVRSAMKDLAGSYKPADLAEVAFSLYERFRPQVATGQRGWGQKGELDLNLIRGLKAAARI
jgi:hypothetical protein